MLGKDDHQAPRQILSALGEVGPSGLIEAVPPAEEVSASRWQSAHPDTPPGMDNTEAMRAMSSVERLTEITPHTPPRARGRSRGYQSGKWGRQDRARGDCGPPSNAGRRPVGARPPPPLAARYQRAHQLVNPSAERGDPTAAGPPAVALSLESGPRRMWVSRRQAPWRGTPARGSRREDSNPRIAGVRAHAPRAPATPWSPRRMRADVTRRRTKLRAPCGIADAACGRCCRGGTRWSWD